MIRRFLSNLRIKSKIPWRVLIFELVIVFSGIYLAFWLTNYSDNQRVKAERFKLMSSLKHELDVMALTFPNMGSYQKNKVSEWSKALQAQQWSDFYDWRYVQPQYNYAVLEYAINTRDARIIPFELFEKLIPIYRSVKKLENSENLLTELASRYESLPPGTDSMLYDNRSMVAQNLFLFRKFIVFGSDRASNLIESAKLASKALKVINRSFTKKELHTLEYDTLLYIFPFLFDAEKDSEWQEGQQAMKAQFASLSLTPKDWASLRQELIKDQQ